MSRYTARHSKRRTLPDLSYSLMIYVYTATKRVTKTVTQVEAGDVGIFWYFKKLTSVPLAWLTEAR